MKTKLELIRNYPIEALKNWGDYFGYPEAVCKNMVDMATVTDWQRAKIAVLDDFGFQMINYLMNSKKVPLQNIYFLVSEEEDEAKVELMRKWYSNFLENNIIQTYNIDMSFDLIIANPPYGKSSSLSRKIVNALTENKAAKEITVLAPPRSCFDNISKVKDYKDVGWTSDWFVDIAACNKVAISLMKMVTDDVNIYSSKEDFLDEKNKQLFRAIENYNKMHKTDFQVEKRSVLECKEDWNKILGFSYVVLCNGYHADLKSVDLSKVTDKTKEGSVDVKFNFGIDFEDYYKRLNGDVGVLRLINMHSELEKNNFQIWWYTNPEGLPLAIRKLMRKNENQTPAPRCYIDYFPNLDWSHPWTDREILKEIGLPEDFLEKEKEETTACKNY